MKKKFEELYIDMAERVAQMSVAQRLKCGTVIVTNEGQGAVFIGYNGTPTGWDNECEFEESHERDSSSGTWLTTKREVLHAEANAITKVARSTLSCDGAVMFSTHSPCFECAKLIYQSGIKAVYFRHKYRLGEGIDFLQKSGVSVHELALPGDGD